MDNDRTVAAIWISAFIAIVVPIFMVAGCVERTTYAENDVRVACLSKGGNWELVPGKTDAFTCRMR